jgi:hypothetical protein
MSVYKSVIINVQSIGKLDKEIIPYVIYNETLNKEKLKIQSYFIKHLRLLYSFVGYNGALKLANQLASNKKCGCYYRLPWKTYYSNENNIKGGVSLSFSQQVEEYRYMILNWYPSPKLSYMQYLSEIALSMILDISQYMYYLQNNLQTCTIFSKKYYLDNFKNDKEFRFYIYQNFANINKKYIYQNSD